MPRGVKKVETKSEEVHAKPVEAKADPAVYTETVIKPAPVTDPAQKDHVHRETHSVPAKKLKRKYPLAPYEGLSDTMVKLSIEVSEDVAEVFKMMGRDIEAEAAALLESQARRLGWL